MREKCARVLAAALMTGAIGFALAMPAIFGTGHDAGPSVTAPPSFLQRSVHVVASARSDRAGQLEGKHPIRPAILLLVVRSGSTRNGSTLASGRPSTTGGRPKPAPKPAPKPTPAPAPVPSPAPVPAPDTRALADNTPPPAVSPPAPSQPAASTGGKGKGKGKGKAHDNDKGKGPNASQPPVAATPPLPANESAAHDGENDHGHGKGNGNSKGNGNDKGRDD